MERRDGGGLDYLLHSKYILIERVPKKGMASGKEEGLS